jgi:hypothetical protein
MVGMPQVVVAESDEAGLDAILREIEAHAEAKSTLRGSVNAPQVSVFGWPTLARKLSDVLGSVARSAR